MSLKKYLVSIILLFFGFSCTMAIAGSPGGLWLVVIPLDNAVVYKDDINYFFNKVMGVDKYIACENTMVSVDVFYITRHPPKITTTLIDQALVDTDKLKLLKKYLRDYRDDWVTSNDGFNGLLSYKVIDENIQFYGFQSWSGGKESDEIYESSLRIADLGNKEKLGNAICLALVKIPVSAP
ncbi:hypothetical protein ACK1ML_004288 [Salmonella enterica]